MAEEQFRSGNQASYAFAAEGVGWNDLLVADLHCVEELGRPFSLSITLARAKDRPPVDLDALLGAAASLAIASDAQGGFLFRHGIVAEAEELESTDAIDLYRVRLVPHFDRARHRRRCRTFLGRTLEEIISSVLMNNPIIDETDNAPTQIGPGGLAPLGAPPVTEETAEELPAYSPPSATFAWNIVDIETQSRLDHRRLRQYVVQYNESDFDFVSRLLEEEGISYFFEHSKTQSVMWLSDRPGMISIFAERSAYRIDGSVEGLSPGREQVIRSFKTSRKLRSGSVKMRDYDWERAGIVLEGRAPPVLNEGADEHFEFPARDEDLRDKPCSYPARVRAERFSVERALSRGTATVRGLPVGRRIRVQNGDGEDRGEYLVVRAETVAVQHHFPGLELDGEGFGFDGRTSRAAPMFEARFVTLSASIPFRPAMSTPRPRIDGVQTATVTDQEGATANGVEIHCDEWARVRVRFPWDQRSDRSPSSNWIRVSQIWAGAGFGGMLIPRVGQEVLVAYVDGDPDEPTIVGRVYNAKNPIPTAAAENPELSTLKSQSSPDAEGFNELQFQDLAGKEEIYLRAQRDLREEVMNDHRTTVGGSQSNSVNGEQLIVVGENRTLAVSGRLVTTVAWYESLRVEGHREHVVDGDDTLTVGADRTVGVHGNDSLEVKGTLGVVVSRDSDLLAHGTVRSMADAEHNFFTGGNFVSSSSASHHFLSHDSFSSEAQTSHRIESPTIKLSSEKTELAQKEELLMRVGDCFIKIEKGTITLNNGAGASVSLVGGKVVVNAESEVTVAASSQLTLKSSQIGLKSGSAERKDEHFKDEEPAATFVFRVYAQGEATSIWDDHYTLVAVDGSFEQSLPASNDGARHDQGYSDLHFEKVPVGKKYDVKAVSGEHTTLLLSGFHFEG